MPKMDLEKLVSNALADYDVMIVELATGEDRDPDDVLETAIKAGRSAAKVQRDVDVVESRIAACAEFKTQRYADRAEDMLAEKRTVLEKIKVAEDELQAAKEKLRTLRERERLLDHNNIINQGKQAQRTLNDFLRKTGRDGSMRPEDFALSD